MFVDESFHLLSININEVAASPIDIYWGIFGSYIFLTQLKRSANCKHKINAWLYTTNYKFSVWVLLTCSGITCMLAKNTNPAAKSFGKHLPSYWTLNASVSHLVPLCGWKWRTWCTIYRWMGCIWTLCVLKFAFVVYPSPELQTCTLINWLQVKMTSKWWEWWR